MIQYKYTTTRSIMQGKIHKKLKKSKIAGKGNFHYYLSVSFVGYAIFPYTSPKFGSEFEIELKSEHPGECLRGVQGKNIAIIVYPVS